MKYSRFYPFILALTVASLACSIFIGGPDLPAETQPSSPAEALSMQEQFQQALIQSAATGTITLEISEGQLTSYLVDKISQNPNPPFTNPQILLRNGQMQMYGKVTQGWFNANMLIVMNVGVDETTGQPKIEVASADFGPIPAPQGINAAISAIIAEAFTGTLGPVAVGFRLESIAIADGVMSLTGLLK